jgi:hypothetical protein
MDYEQGLEQLKRLATGTDWYPDVLSYEARLRETLDFERRYGTNDQTRTNRAQIIDQLNRLSYEHLKRSFNDLCLPSSNAKDEHADEMSWQSESKVFISYSRKDSRYLKELHSNLDFYVRANVVKYWDDTKIQPGSLWKQELQQALDTAKIAILLVSPDFLASDFIFREELPRILDAANRSSMVVFCVIVRPSLFGDTDLRRFQTVNPPSQPLSTMNQGKRDEVWVRVAKLVKDTLQ